MSADDLLAGPLDAIDVAHLAAEHRAACDEIHQLRAELRRLQRVIIDAELLTHCEDLCMVLCAGPCQGEGRSPELAEVMRRRADEFRRHYLTEQDLPEDRP